MGVLVQRLLEQIVTSLRDHLAITVTALLVLGSILIQNSQTRKNPVTKIPSVGFGWEFTRRVEFLFGGAQRLYTRGYQKVGHTVARGLKPLAHGLSFVADLPKFKGSIYRVTNGRDSPSVVVPPQFLPELSKLPEDVLSFPAAFHETMQLNHVKVDLEEMQPVSIMKKFINPSLARLNLVVSEALDQAIGRNIPDSDTWTEVQISKSLLRIIAMSSGCIFIGPEHCYTESYLDISSNFTVTLFTAVQIITLFPPWMRRILAPVLPFVRKVYRREQEANRILLPVVLARRAALREKINEQPENMLDWLISEQTKAGIENNHVIVHKLIGGTVASLHATTHTAIQVFYALCADSSLAEILRSEALDALAESDGRFTAKALQDMKKTDSFIKEVMRFFPLQLSTFQRKSLKPFTLSNGQVIPAGVTVEAPNGPVSQDPEIFDNPEVFDALRYFKIRQAQDSTTPMKTDVLTNSHLVSTGPVSLSWGYGRQACPGRFFAANQIKMMIAKFLLKYDLKLPNGISKPYPTINYAGFGIPNLGKTILIKKR